MYMLYIYVLYIYMCSIGSVPMYMLYLGRVYQCTCSIYIYICHDEEALGRPPAYLRDLSVDRGSFFFFLTSSVDVGGINSRDRGRPWKAAGLTGVFSSAVY